MKKAEFIVFTFDSKTISFNRESVRKKTLKKFSEDNEHHGLTPEQYKEVHDLCTGKVKKTGEESAPEQVK